MAGRDGRARPDPEAGPGPGLSVDQRLRLALAKALAAEPRVIILDESLAAVDVSLRPMW